MQYGDVTLRRLVFDADYRSDKWPPAVAAAIRRRHQSLRAAAGRAELERLRSLDLRVHDNDTGGRCSIKLADGARLLLDFDSEKAEQVSVVEIVPSEVREATR